MKRALSILLALAATTAVTAEDPERMTIERLYTMPRLIGTAPSGFAWSPDSQRLAFLWNDEGYNFRDVWTVDVPGGEPVRVTGFPHFNPKETEDATERLEQEVRIERDRGASEVTWHPNGRHLLVTFRGDLYLVAPGNEPQEVRSPDEAASRPAYSPDGKYLGYVSGGDLWMDAASNEGPEQPHQSRQRAYLGPKLRVLSRWRFYRFHRNRPYQRATPRHPGLPSRRCRDGHGLPAAPR